MSVQMHLRCIICGNFTSGNAVLGYLCGNCNMVFSHSTLRAPESRKKQITAFIEYVTSNDTETYHVPECKYARRIQNKIILSYGKQTGLRPCSCVTRTGESA